MTPQFAGCLSLFVPDIDFRTLAPTFVDALKQIRRLWSQANRRHVPIMILVELKEDSIQGLPARPVPFGKEEIDSVDAEIRSVFQQGEILTPDRVRGTFASLPEAIKSRGWPTLEDVARAGDVRAGRVGVRARPLSRRA